jgi:hypothetical protein
LGGKVGVNTDPDNTYTLKINGSTNITGEIAIGGNTTIEGDLTVPDGESIYIDEKTLPEYIKANSKSLIDFSVFGDTSFIDLGTLFGKDARASALVSNQVVTLKAPAGVPTATGMFLKSTSTAGGSAWSPIQASNISVGSNDEGKVLIAGSAGGYWGYLKKKFDVTMSGTTTVNLSGYYTTLSKTRYKEGKVVNIYQYKDSNGAWTGRAYAYQGTPPSSATILYTYTLQGDEDTACYSRSAAGSKEIDVTLKGTSGEITLDGAASNGGNIAITITGATDA